MNQQPGKMWEQNGSVSGIAPEHNIMPFQQYDSRILPQMQNGRVNNLSEVKGDRFNMFTVNNNNDNTAKDTILYGTISRSNLSDTFFSKQNMKHLQDMLRYRVFIASKGKYKISNQDETELLVIQRAMFLQHSKNLPYNINGQIDELNEHVIAFILPKIMSEIKQWIYYSDDIQHLPTLMELPKNVSSAGTRSLPSVTTTF